MVTGMLQMQCSNPIIFEICEQLKQLKGKDFPKNDKELMNLCQTTTKNFYGKMWTSLKDKIGEVESPEGKIFYQKRLEKLSSVMDILESISEDSSKEYLKQVTNEIFHIFSENEEI